MNLKRAVYLMEQHQLWRRGEIDEPPAQPHILGAALDRLIKECKKLLGE